MGRLNVVVVSANEHNCREIYALLKQANIPVAPLYSLEDLYQHLKNKQVAVLIIDLNILSVDNNFFRSLKKQYPNLHILCLSSRTYHTGLGETMRSASLARPLNSEELFLLAESHRRNLVPPKKETVHE